MNESPWLAYADAMNLHDLERRHQIRHNEDEYGLRYNFLAFVTEEQALAATRRRDELLASMGAHLRLAFHDTKPHYGELSPGCRACGEGGWSCLFVNGLCNASCSYCPTEQTERDVPTTQTLKFPDPSEYAEYVAKFGFTGVSFSGGEPLVTFDRTVELLRAVRRRCPEMWLWMYTNGKLADRAKLTRLRDEGLDEIRFNVGAVDYDLGKVELAVGLIPNVTVEIPAVPDERERLFAMSERLDALGARWLNLHTLRLTPRNYPELVERGYTFLHGPRVTVLESELTALEVMRHAAERGLRLGVNYCAFTFTQRHQAPGLRRRLAETVKAEGETVTECGALRRIHTEGGEAKVSYAVPIPRSEPSLRRPCREVTLDARRSVFVELDPVVTDRELSPAELELLLALAAGTPPNAADFSGTSADLAQWECIRSGLGAYY